MITKIANEQDAQARRYTSLMWFLQTSLPSGFGSLERDQMEANLLQTKILNALRGHEPIQNQFLGLGKEPTIQSLVESLVERSPPALSVLRTGNKEASRQISDPRIGLHVKAL